MTVKAKDTELEKSKGAKRLQPLTAKQLSKGSDGDDEGGDEGGDDDADEKENPFQKGIPPQFQKKGKDDGDDKDSGEEDDKDDDQGKVEIEVKKSDGKDVTATDLDKSIAKLAEFTQSNDTVSRKDALLSKAAKGDLSKAENEELFSILGGKATGEKEPTLGAQVTKGLTENSDLQKALDVSEYLDAQHTELCKSLVALGDQVEKSGKRQHDFNLVLSKAIIDVGNVVKSINERLGTIEDQPARGPKSRGVQTVEKSFAGHKPAGSGDDLSKSQILDGMEKLLEKSTTGVSEHGEDILMAISKYESTNQISKSLLSEVVQTLGKSATH